MRKLHVVFSFVALCFVGVRADAGGMEGGGGKTVVCRSADGAITSAEALDLYEGRVQYGLSYEESRAPYLDQVTTVFQNAGLMEKCTPPPGEKCSTSISFPPSSITDFYNLVRDHLKFVPVGTVLKPIDDSLEVITPRNCAPEQTVNYQNDNLILVSTEIWSALSETQRAALLIHEATYRYLRNYKEKDSRRARHLTAFMFSGGKIEEPYPGNDYAALCYSVDPHKPQFSFYVSKHFRDASGKQKLRLSFSEFGGRHLISKSTTEVFDDPSTGPGLLERLAHPDGRDGQLILQSYKTDSLFERGDTYTLRVGTVTGESKITISGTSGVNGEDFDEQELRCLLAANPN